MAALFQRAVGYSHPAVKFFFDKDAGRVVSQKYTEHYPPDTGACVMWLKNRQPKHWREGQGPEDTPPPSGRYIIIDRVNENGEKSGETELRTEPKE